MTKLENLTDIQITEKSKTNPDDFTEIIHRYEGRLFSFVKRISYFEHEDIEDIIQETFIKTYRNLNGFSSDMKFSTWIYQIARNTTIDAIRKKHTRPQSSYLEESDLTKILKSNTNLEREFAGKDQLEKVRNVIDALPYKYKEVVILKFLENKSYEEIMDIVKKPKGTVAALINRAKKIIFTESVKQKII